MTRQRVTAQRGLQLRCLGWRQETILRMLENNLENAEKPDELIVYNGVSRAARDWDAFDRIVETLKKLREDQTLVIQSGKPIGVFETHERAPLVVMANGNAVGRWASDEWMLKYEKLGLTYLPGMTAAAWQYIGSQGILQGTYQSFLGAARQYFGGSLAGRMILTAGCGGMGGAQPLAGKLAGAAILVVDVDERRIRRRIETGYCDRMTASLDEALRWIDDAKATKQALSVGLVGNAAQVHPFLLERGVVPDIVTDQTMTDPHRGYCPAGLSPDQAETLRKSDPAEAARRANASILRHVEAMLEFKRRGALVFEYGNGLRLRAADAGLPAALEMESFVTLFIRPLFCEGFGPFRWLAISGNPGDIDEVDALVKETFSNEHPIHDWIDLARRHVKFQGLPARIGWLGHGERSRLAVRVNEAVASGRISGPIAFTRDMLDSGSVASPMRETEKMQDGSEAISDWPLLNALLATSGGADLVAIHANSNRSQSAGQTAIAVGTPEAGKRLKAVLDGDTGIGVLRHADAGYEIARKTAERHGLGLPS
jgi:urocanate hydratase